jgi:hypothetical protein
LEHDETPDPPRSDALESRIQCVRPASGRRPANARQQKERQGWRLALIDWRHGQRLALID